MRKAARSQRGEMVQEELDIIMRESGSCDDVGRPGGGTGGGSEAGGKGGDSNELPDLFAEMQAAAEKAAEEVPEAFAAPMTVDLVAPCASEEKPEEKAPQGG